MKIQKIDLSHFLKKIDVSDIPKLALIAVAYRVSLRALKLIEKFAPIYTSPVMRPWEKNEIPEVDYARKSIEQIKIISFKKGLNTNSLSKIESYQKYLEKLTSGIWENYNLDVIDHLTGDNCWIGANAANTIHAANALIIEFSKFNDSIAKEYFEPLLNFYIDENFIIGQKNKIDTTYYDMVTKFINYNIDDLELIQQVSKDENWNDHTKVPEDFFSSDNQVEKQIILLVNDLCVKLCEIVAENPNAIRQIEWRMLERVVATSLKGIGFNVQLTPSSKDGGKDVIATCRINGESKIFYIEIKHWISGKKVSMIDVSHFIEVNVKENTSGGLFLSTSGYAQDVFSQLSEIHQKRIRIGNDNKIVSLCQQFVQSRKSAIWKANNILPEIIISKYN